MTHVFTFRTATGLLIVEHQPKGQRPGARTYVLTLTEVQLLDEPSKRADYVGTIEGKYERTYTEGSPEENVIDLIEYVYGVAPEDL